MSENNQGYVALAIYILIWIITLLELAGKI